MLPLPKSPLDSIKLADWIEIYALLSPDLNSSYGDLVSALRTSGLLNGSDKDAIERNALDVFSELEMRAAAADSAYPYVIDGRLITAKKNWKHYAPYIFCLCLSYFGWKQKKGNKIFPQRLFEYLACDVARSYVNGKALRFASPRREFPTSFKEAVNHLCLHCLREGKGFRQQPGLQSKDDTVDIVAWAEFPDYLSGKILMFGNCASGNDWEEKVDELQPPTFCNQWMIEPPPSAMLKAFFIPHRIDRPHWDYYTRKTGVIFDRCRIAYLADKLTGATSYDSKSAGTWVQSILNGVAG